MGNMLVLLGDEPSNSLFIQLFLEQMPASIRKVLMHLEISDPRQLAQKADTM